MSAVGATGDFRYTAAACAALLRRGRRRSVLTGA